MKIYKRTVVIIFSLFLSIQGAKITEMSVQEGNAFIFHLPNTDSDTLHISSVEWKQMESNKLLAQINPVNANKTVVFEQRSRLEFMQNGSFVIRDVTQEDTGTYICKIIFKGGKIQTHIVLLTFSSESTEQSPTHNPPSTAGLPYRYILQTVIPVIGGSLLLVSVLVIILKCKRKRFMWGEHIYSNTNVKHKQRPRTCN